jgi:uncharacterized protein (DUF2147 family)
MRTAVKKHLPRRLTAYPITRMLMIFIFFQAVADVIPQTVRNASASPLDTPGQSTPVGFWVTEDGNWVVQISPCNGEFCGQLVVLSKSHRPDAVRLDARNPDPAKRHRPLCGLRLLGGFTPSDDSPGKWQGGWVYDPENGETYSSHMWLAGPDTLKIRGFVLTPWLGRNETLKRETNPIKHCSVSPAA